MVRTWNSNWVERRQILRKLCDPGLEAGDGVGKGKDLHFRGQDYRGARRHVCVCVCVHTHEGNYSATQWLARHKDYSSPCEQSQNANRKLDFMSVGVLSSRVVQKLIQVTFEFSFVWKTLNVLKFINPNALGKLNIQTYVSTFLQLFFRGTSNYTQFLNCIWTFSMIHSF